MRTKDRIFDSVSHLVNHHCDNALPIISADSALVLKNPIIRRSYWNDIFKFYYFYIQVIDQTGSILIFRQQIQFIKVRYEFILYIYLKRHFYTLCLDIKSCGWFFNYRVNEFTKTNGDLHTVVYFVVFTKDFIYEDKNNNQDEREL